MSDDRTFCIVPDCDEQPYPSEELCLTHLREQRYHDERNPMQGLADRGCDTWEEYRGER